ncbi:MAG: type II toxin-antitoxin system PemK/MazF family toxin [Sulfuricurvum sp.]
MVEKYIPQKGDLVILTFDPQAGHEQQGRRPALIISNNLFNQRVENRRIGVRYSIFTF